MSRLRILAKTLGNNEDVLCPLWAPCCGTTLMHWAAYIVYRPGKEHKLALFNVFLRHSLHGATLRVDHFESPLVI